MSDNLPVPLVRAWSMVLALKKLGFTDAEIAIGAVRTLPGMTEAGMATGFDPRKAYYALAVVVTREGKNFTIQVSEWPAEPDLARVAWAGFCNNIKTGKVAMPVLQGLAAKHVFDPKKLEADCRERGLLT